MKNRYIVLLLSFAVSISAYCADAEKMDTLLVAEKAKSIEISSEKGNCRIVVEDIDDTGDRFCYEKISKSSPRVQTSTITSSHITNIVILASSSPLESMVSVSYVDNSGSKRSFSQSAKSSSAADNTIGYYRGKDSFLDLGVTLSRKGKTRWSAVSSGIGIGWVAPLSSNVDMDVDMGSSIELTWTNVIAVEMSHGRHHASLGIGLDWRNLVTHGNLYYDKDDKGRIVMMPYEAGVKDKRSRIKIFSLQMPLLYRCDFGKKQCCGFTFGPVLNFNTSASIKTSWRDSDREYSVKTKHIGQRPVTVDIMGAFNYRCIGVYARYAPMNMFKDSSAMKFGAFSTGLMLFF